MATDDDDEDDDDDDDDTMSLPKDKDLIILKIINDVFLYWYPPLHGSRNQTKLINWWTNSYTG